MSWELDSADASSTALGLSTLQEDAPAYPASQLLGFPSPADEDLTPSNLTTPFDAPSFHPSSDPLLAEAVSASIPRPPQPVGIASETPTPFNETGPKQGVEGLLGDSLSLAANLPSPPISKVATRNLRLPSFDLLGIAGPRPVSNVSGDAARSPWLGGGGDTDLEATRPLSELSPGDMKARINHPPAKQCATTIPLTTNINESTPSASPDCVQPGHRAVNHYIMTHTPPDEAADVDWDAETNSRTAAAPGEASRDVVEIRPGLPLLPQYPNSKTLHHPRQDAPWLEEVIPLILDSAREQAQSRGEIKMVSQALPLPSTAGHAFPVLIDAVHRDIKPEQMVWMNVFHAVPGSINLSDLPKSPPGTPAPPHEADDYFATKVFDSAVAVPDYQLSDARTVISPKPAVTPGSVDVAVVERYIPPTSAKEFTNLFFNSVGSILSDRLIELSPHDGTLTFIYPTKRGGKTFVHDYLSPVIDPLLRRLMITETLHASLMDELGSMKAVDSMMSFEDVRARMHAFCEQLSTGEKTPINKYASTNSAYTLVHASKHEVQVNKEVWATEWWARQEKPRIRQAVLDYHSKNKREGTNAPLFAGAELVETILKGVTEYKYQTVASQASTESLDRLSISSQPSDRRVKPPTAGIEVGVYVIRRSLPTPKHE